MPIRDRAGTLGISLSFGEREIRVGTLARKSTGEIAFTVDAAYVEAGSERPLFSLAWKGADEEDTKRRLTATADKLTKGTFLPPFFANVLPEGALRDLVKREFGAGDFDDFDVLARLGEDLPGAVVARQESGEPAARAAGLRTVNTQATKPIRFSLAGVQLKFSMQFDRGTMTVPATGADGDIILKTPSPKYPQLPEMEFSAMSLCRAIGVRTADVWLIDGDKVQGIPSRILAARRAVPRGSSLRSRQGRPAPDRGLRPDTRRLRRAEIHEGQSRDGLQRSKTVRDRPAGRGTGGREALRRQRPDRERRRPC